MSAAFMFFIAACYAGACISFLVEGKPLWAVISLSWGIGNAVLAVVSQ